MHLPVTALATAPVNEQCVILVGQGPYLRLYDGRTSELLSSQRIFDVQPIHHIAPQSGSVERPIVVAGGRHVASVAIGLSEGSSLAVRTTSPQSINAKEWILRAHPHDGAFLFLTTNNNLLKLDLSGHSGEPEPIRELAQGPGSFLYSGDVYSVNTGKILVAAGSVFGEVLVWTCAHLAGNLDDRWVTQATHRFEGHTGSIFGVRISEQLTWENRPARFVASCSDDRTVQLWDVSDYDDPSLAVNGVEAAASTGFGQDAQDSQHRVAMGWGHQSRIWDVDFLMEADNTDLKQLQLATRGEDGTCQFWAASLPSRETAARVSTKVLPVSSDRYHSGKNVWAWTRFRQGNVFVIASGGADGRVVTRTVPDSMSGGRRGAVAYSRPFKQLPLAPSPQLLKEYAVVNGETTQEILAVTGSGNVVRCSPGADGDGLWDVIVSAVGFCVLKLCTNAPPGVLIAATTNGILIRCEGCEETMVGVESLVGKPVAWMQVAGASKSTNAEELHLCVVVTSMAGNACLVWVEQTLDSLHIATQTLQVPEHFIVTSSSYEYAVNMLVLGSRAGAVAVYSSLRRALPASPEPICIRHVHGSDAVTSLQFLQALDGNQGQYVLSTGRDGRYGIHRIITGTTQEPLVIRTIHSACPPFGPYVEGASVVPNYASARKDLILHGFRSKDFVVWNETQQLDVFSVDCGGAHRSWVYRHRASIGHEGGSFVWTKASNFNLYSESSPRHQMVQTGGHGREIKALAVCARRYSSPEHHLLNAPLFATGAEDTTIRVFALRLDSQGADSGSRLVQLCTMNDHTTGLQDLVFSPYGDFLFSSGGAEQLYAWRISYDVPLIGIGSVLQDKMPQTDDDSDVRIMGISLCTREAAPAHTFSLAAAYSNGKVKLLRYDPAEMPGKGTWLAEREVLFGSFCLMQVFHLTVPARSETTASLLTAGTNGFVNLTELQASEGNRQLMKVHSVHQSSVLAMDVADLGSGSHFVATGGDDNALGLTVLIRGHGASSNSGDATFATVRIRDAHAAALTALKILPRGEGDVPRGLRVATAGDDQMVKVWEVEVTTGKPVSPTSFQVTRLRECWTAVADVSCIDAVGTRLLVTGVGTEVLDLDLNIDR